MLVKCVGKSFTIDFEEDEPAFRSCFQCNGSHKHLMNTNSVHSCYSCGRFWLNGKYFTDFETEEGLLEHFKLSQKQGCSIKVIDEGKVVKNGSL